LNIQEELVLSDDEETGDEADIGGHLTIPDAEGPHSLLNPQDYTDEVSSPLNSFWDFVDQNLRDRRSGEKQFIGHNMWTR
jgi:hypothetical protein